MLEKYCILQFIKNSQKSKSTKKYTPEHPSSAFDVSIGISYWFYVYNLIFETFFYLVR